MQRVVVALHVVAALFALLVFELGLGQDHHRSAWIVFGSALVVGYPSLYLCCKRGWWSPWQVCLLGGLGGLVCAMPFTDGRYGTGFLLATLVIAGLALGGIFWLLAIWRNDNLTCPKSFCLPCGTAYRFARNALRQSNLP